MVEKKKVLLILSIVSIILIFIFIIYKSNSIKKVSINNIESTLSDNNYSVVFCGDYNRTIYNELVYIEDEYEANVYRFDSDREEVIDYIIYELDLDDNVSIDGNIYAIYNKSELIGYIDDNFNKEDYLKKYFKNYIPVNERYYKSPNSRELSELIQSKNASILVFGEDSCSFCNKMEHVINEISSEGKYIINYINFTRLTEEEASAIYDMDITVPAECNKSGGDILLKDGYAKPMTIVMKKGKVIGCVKGYYEASTYISKLNKILE